MFTWPCCSWAYGKQDIMAEYEGEQSCSPRGQEARKKKKTGLGVPLAPSRVHLQKNCH